MAGCAKIRLGVKHIATCWCFCQNMAGCAKYDSVWLGAPECGWVCKNIAGCEKNMAGFEKLGLVVVGCVRIWLGVQKMAGCGIIWPCAEKYGRVFVFV